MALLLSLLGTATAARPDASPVALSPTPPEGETIYFGSVFPLRETAGSPTYVYERRVEARDGGGVSTHVTRDPKGDVALSESAVHGADYSLIEYTLHQDQLGQSGTIRVDGGVVTFQRLDARSERRRTERASDPVVVGPTLVGQLVQHLGPLRAGEVLRLRFAVLERLQTIGFTARAVEQTPAQTRVQMKVQSPVFALFVRPLYFTFDAHDALIRLEGRVPPKVRDGQRWKNLDARVEYQYVADGYR